MNTDLNTISFNEFVDLFNYGFASQKNFVKPQAETLFKVADVPQGSGEMVNITEVDTDTFGSRKPEGALPVKAKKGKGYSITIKMKRYGKELDITEEFRMTNKYPELEPFIFGLAHYLPQRLELDLTHRITFGNANSYVNADGEVVDLKIGDGLALFASAHTLLYSTTTFSNNLSGNTAFSQSALEQMEYMASTQIFNHYGEKRVKDFNTIFCADNPVVINAIRMLLNSTSTMSSNGSTTNGNSGIMNPYQDKYRLVVLPYLATTATGGADLTKVRWWGIVATGNTLDRSWQAHLKFWERPHQSKPVEDNRRDTYTFGVRGTWNIGVLSASGIIISMTA